MPSLPVNRLFRFCILLIIAFYRCTAIYSQESQPNWELDQAIDNVKNAHYDLAIPVLKKYAEMNGFDDLKNLEIIVYLNSCYLKIKDNALNVDKVNSLTDNYISKHGISKTDSINSLKEIAMIYIAASINQSVGNYEKMISFLLSIRVHYEEIMRIPPFDLLLSLADGYYYLKDYNSAIKFGSQSWEINSQLNGELNQTSLYILDLLYNSLTKTNQKEKSIECLETITEIEKTVLGEKGLTYLESLNNLAEDYSNIGHNSKALEVILKVVELRKEVLGDTSTEYLSSLNNLAGAYSRLGEYEKAFEINAKLVELSKNVLGENNPIYLDRLRSLAEGYEHFGDYKNSLTIYLRIAEIRKNILGEKSQDLITTYENLGKSYSENGDYLQALETKLIVCDLYKESFGELSQNYIVSLANLAVGYSYLGQYQKALKIKIRAVELGQNVFTEKDPRYLLILSNLVMGYINIGDYQKALDISLKVVDLEKEVLGEKNRNYLTCLSNLSLIYIGLRDYQKALDISIDVWELRKDILGENHPDYLQSLSFIERLYYGLGDYETSLQTCQLNIKLTKRVLGENHPYYLSRLNNLSLTEFQLMKYDSALNHLIEVINRVQNKVIEYISMMTEIQREQYWAKNRNYFYPLPLFLEKVISIHPERVSDAYNSVLFTKGLLLNTTIDFDKLIAEKGTPEAIAKFEDLKLIKLQIQRLNEKPIAERYLNVDSLENIAQQQETELVKISKEYGDYTSNLKVNWKDIQVNLQDNDVAIEFVEYPTLTDTVKYSALVLRKGWQYPKYIPLFRKDEIEGFIKLDKNVIYSNHHVGKQIKNLIWTPLETVVSPGERVCFSPAGILHQLAIENIPVDDSITLGDRYQMYRLSSTKELALHQTESQNHVAVLYGGLQYDVPEEKMKTESEKYEKHENLYAMRGYSTDTTLRKGWEYLTGTLQEVDQISRLMKEKKYYVTKHTGASGNEESFKSLSGTGIGIIHIATHGFFYSIEESKKNLFMQMRMGDQQETSAGVDPMLRSGLGLAGGNRAWQGEKVSDSIEDGVLTAREISRMDLRGTDLVVLSACETGLGEVSSEGVFGLQRSFKQAGVRTLVMSLWEVSDQATRKMMTEFYSNLLSGKDKRTAFLEAKRKCKKEFPEPQYWAAFIMLD